MSDYISPHEKKRLNKMMMYERKARSNGFSHIAGVDEAGRGPLAGPVVAAACLIPEDFYIEGVDDSKKIQPDFRKEIYQKVTESPGVFFGVGVIDSLMIDKINILQATFQAMSVAIAQLPKYVDYILVDGNQMPSTSISGEAIVKGDSLSFSVAVASIIAKVIRDQIMLALHGRWPEYGFDRHKGYATKSHLEAIKKYGLSPIHRKGFKPNKSLILSEELW